MVISISNYTLIMTCLLHQLFILFVIILVLGHPFNQLFMNSPPHDTLYCYLKSRPVVSPGARKPSVGERIESSWPLICSFSPFMHTSLLLCFYTPLVVCISANNNNNKWCRSDRLLISYSGLFCLTVTP